MKWFWGSIWTALLAALCSAAIVANEERIKQAFAEQSVIADVHTGFWQPYPMESSTSVGDAMKGTAASSVEQDMILSDGESHFATVIVHNRGFSDVQNSRLQTGNRSTDILVVSSDGKERTFFNDASDVILPVIPAGKDTKIYMWSIHDMDSMHILGDFRIFTDKGRFLIKYIRYKDRYSVYSDEPAWMQFVGGWLPIILFILLGLGLFGAMIIGVMWETYVKKLLKDDGFYINEKIKYDADPKSFRPDMAEAPKT